jgi:hypothetical protein
VRTVTAAHMLENPAAICPSPSLAPQAQSARDTSRAEQVACGQLHSTCVAAGDSEPLPIYSLQPPQAGNLKLTDPADTNILASKVSAAAQPEAANSAQAELERSHSHEDGGTAHHASRAMSGSSVPQADDAHVPSLHSDATSGAQPLPPGEIAPASKADGIAQPLSSLNKLRTKLADNAVDHTSRSWKEMVEAAYTELSALHKNVDADSVVGAASPSDSQITCVSQQGC